MVEVESDSSEARAFVERDEQSLGELVNKEALFKIVEQISTKKPNCLESRHQILHRQEHLDGFKIVEPSFVSETRQLRDLIPAGSLTKIAAGQLPTRGVQIQVDQIVYSRVTQAAEQARVCECFQCKTYAASLLKWYRIPKRAKKDNVGVIARSWIDFSGLKADEKEDIFQVALGRAMYIREQLIKGEDPEPYEGRYPGIVNIATNSIFLDLVA